MITVGSLQKTETYELNGGMSARQALAKYFNTTSTNVSSSVNNKVVRLNGNDLTNFDTPLRDNDVITIYAREVAAGGVKGAVLARIVFRS